VFPVARQEGFVFLPVRSVGVLQKVERLEPSGDKISVRFGSLRGKRPEDGITHHARRALRPQCVPSGFLRHLPDRAISQVRRVDRDSG
uniref:Uncharacterized protein n=1 Tax=Anopheles albimanus TaxID=7167 RepID=A0A182FY90_ANOAL